MLLKFLTMAWLALTGSVAWAQLQFVPVTPCRVADTRGPSGAFGGPSMAGGGSRSFVVPQSACDIPASAQAYSFNVTVVPKGPLSYLTLWPTGQSQPFVSTLNSFGGEVVANAAIVPAGTGGAVSVFVTDPTDVILDINGYFAASTASGAYSFYPAAPCRVADTRGATGEFGGPEMTAGQSRDFPIPLSACDIPATARGYSLNATVVPSGYLGYLTTWPTGQAQPNASTLNSWQGKIVANAALVPAGTNESISVYVSNPTNVVLDINGYFGQPGQAGALSFYPVTPCRVADTRKANGPFGGPEMGLSTTRSFPIPASGCGIPATAAAYSLNVTVVPDGPLAYLTLWPFGSAQPDVSTLNSFDGSVVANAAIVPAGEGGGIDVYVTNPTQVILDIDGYFAGSTGAGSENYTITGMVSGLNSGASVVLKNNNTDALTVSANGSFTFATALASGASYAVTVGTQPGGETCQVANGGAGVVSADVTNVVVTCTPVPYTIGGTVSGLSNGASVVLLDNGAGALTVSANGSFTFTTPLLGGASYTVTVGTEPSGEGCQVTNGGPAVVSGNVTNVAVTCTTGNVVAERVLAQTGLSIAMASNTLASQALSMVGLLLVGSSVCKPAPDGTWSLSGGSRTALPVTSTLYYDANCTQPYIVVEVTAATNPNGDTNIAILSETVTYYGLTGGTLGTATLTVTDDADSNVLSGVGVFTPAGGAKTPVQLGLYCVDNGTPTSPCVGAVAQDFPALGLAIGAATTLNLTVPADTGALTFTGNGSPVTGPIGSLTLMNPSETSLVLQGGTVYTSITATGGAGAFDLFPPTPTGWTVTDAAHDEKFQISVIDDTTRNSNITITKVSTGKTLSTGTVDKSGTGSITYSDGSTAAITAWTLAD